MKITKSILEDEVKLLAGRNIKLAYIDQEYKVLCNNALIFTGTARETYIFLQGFKCGIVASGAPIAATPVEDTYPLYEMLKTRKESGKGITIEAKKTATDPYFSQHKSVYNISIEKVTPNKLYFTTRTYLLSPNGMRYNGEVAVGLMEIQISKDLTINTLGEAMLKQIDSAMIDMAKKDRNISSDRIMWITFDTLRTVGWSNQKLITKAVNIRVI